MKRLPVYDRTTGRVEGAAFTSLGLIGAALITMAVRSSLHFSEAREGIAASLCVSISNRTTMAQHGLPTFTNVTPAHTAGGSTFSSDKTRQIN